MVGFVTQHNPGAILPNFMQAVNTQHVISAGISLTIACLDTGRLNNQQDAAAKA